MAKAGFKKCSCGYIWADRTEFLNDATVNLIGYQVHFEELQAGFFLFNHRIADCGTTLAMGVRDFADLYNGPVFEERMTGGQSCSGLCQQRENLERCPVHCECAFVREVIAIVRNWPTRKGRAA